MQIESNTTGMEAELTLIADKDARDQCVVVVKGTFTVDALGQLTLADTQKPLVYADEHYGDPGTTSIRYECDFALEKPFTDVLVVGKAVSPKGVPVQHLSCALEVQGRVKKLIVFGDRYWMRRFGLLTPSPAKKFTEMPITYDGAFGGMDDSKGTPKIAVEPENLAGIGFHRYRSAKEIDGTPLPNVERPGKLISSAHDKPEPIGYGCISRNAKQRVQFAGTYDQHWLDNVCPFLPEDFDSRYFQSAPIDQQFPTFTGGEHIRCQHMSIDSTVTYIIPKMDIPVRYNFIDRTEKRFGVLDTVILEPHDKVAILIWRTKVPVGKKLNMLRTVEIGEPLQMGDDGIIGQKNGKPHFKHLNTAIKWIQKEKLGEI
nr:DUF2169 domain-containing protein [uncultured Desulfobacter sp.]